MTQTRLDDRRTQAAPPRRTAPLDILVAHLVDDLAAGLEPEPALVERLLLHPDHLTAELAHLYTELPHIAELVSGFLGLGAPLPGRTRLSRQPELDALTTTSTAMAASASAVTSLDERLDALLVRPDTLTQTTALYEELRAEIGLMARPRLELAPLPEDRLGESRPGLVRLGEGFDPSTREGRALLAHELVHEAQRSLTGAPDLLGAEHEASSVMSEVLAGGRASAPVVPLPSFALAACGPRAMRDRVEPEPDPDPDPVTHIDDKRPDPVPPPNPGRRPIVHVPKPVEIPVPYPVADTPVPTVELPPNAVVVPVPFPVRVYAPAPTETPTPADPEVAACEEKCPEPLPEHLGDAPVKKPAKAPPGEGGVRTLKLAGHLIQLRLPKDAKAGQLRVRFRNADSPFGALTLKTAVLTLDDELRITGGYLSADVQLGRFVHAPDVHLTVTANGNVALTIKDARLQVGSVAKGKVDLTIGHEGIWGQGIITAKDLVVGPSLTITDGRLAVRVSRGGAVTAHGKLSCEFKKLGTAEVEVCFADGKLSGKVTAELKREINLGLAKITRVKLSGCLREGQWSLEGEVDFTVRSWVKGTAVATVEGGRGRDPEWTFKGDLHQTKVLSLGPLDIHDAHLTVEYAKGRWAPAKCDLLYQLPKVRGKLEGTIDLETWKVNGQGQAEIWDPIKVGPVSLDEGELVATIKDNELTEVIGQATLRVSFQGQPTFEVTCEQAIYTVKTGDLHARGEMNVVREVVLGNPARLHAKIPRGRAGQYSYEYNRLVQADSNLAIHVNHGESPVGIGSMALAWTEAGGVSGHLEFALVGRTGLPSFSDGPLFLLPGGNLRVDIAESAIGMARASGLQWELVQGDGAGHICGTLDGHYDFDKGGGSLTGEAWVHGPWVIALGQVGTVTLERGGELTTRVGDRGLEHLQGSLAFGLEATGGPLSGLALEGSLSGSFDPETRTASGSFDVAFADGARVPLPELGPYRLVATGGTSLGGRLEKNALAGPMRTTLVFDLEKNALPFLKGRLDEGTFDLARGEVTGQASLSLAEGLRLDKGVGRFAVSLDPKSTLRATLDKSAVSSIGGDLVLGLDEAGQRSAELIVSGDLGDSFSGAFDLKVLQNIRLAGRRVGATDFGVDLSTETGGKLVLVDSEPTSTEGKLVLEVVGDGVPFARGSFEVAADFSGAKTPITVDGELKVFESLPLGRAGDFGLSLAPPTSARARLVDGGLESLEGTLHLGLERDAEEVGLLQVGGTCVAGETPQVGGQAEISIIKGFALFDAGPYTLGFAPSTFSATMAKGQITRVDGKFGLHLEQRGSPEEAPLGSLTVALEGSYVREAGAKSGRVDGEGTIAVDGELRVAQASDYSVHVTSGSDCTITISENEISKVDGQVVGRVDQANPRAGEDKRFLGIDAEAHYRPEEGGKLSAKGKAAMLGRRRIFEGEGASFWLAPGVGETSATIVVVDNDVKSLEGTIGAEVHDKLGPLFGATVSGTWTASTGKLDGKGSVSLLRDVSIPEGKTSGARIEVLAGSGGTAQVTASRLEGIDGTVKVRVHDERGPLVEVTGSGALDAGTGRIERLAGSARLLRPIEVGGVGEDALVRITELSGLASFSDGELDQVSGALAFELPRLGRGFVGKLGGGWRKKREGEEEDTWWGSGELDLPILDDKAKGRRLGGRVGVQVAPSGAWTVNGKLDYQLAPRIGGQVSVAMTDELDPVIGVDFDASGVKLADARPLFDKELTILPQMTLGTGLLQFSFGVTAGLGLSMGDLKATARIRARDWKPLSDNTSVPDFEASLAMTWGLDARAELAAYMKLSLGLGSILSVNGGVRAGLVLDVPIQLAPSGRIWGNKDGFGGELDVGLSIKPKLGLSLTPFLGGELIGFDIGPHEFEPFTFDLGAPFELDWSTSYGFGDKPRAPKAKARSGAAVEGGQVVQKKEQHETPKRFPTRQATPSAAEEGLPTIGAEAESQALGGGDKGGENKLQAMKRALDALTGLAMAASHYMELGQNPMGLVFDRGAHVKRMKAAWERVAAEGRKLFAACEEIFGALKYSIPMWVRLIIEAPPGQTPDFLEAWAEEDDHSRRLVAAGVHGALPIEGQVQLIEAMMRGSCGDEDEASILKMLDHAHRHGYAKDLVQRVGAKRLKKNIDGAEHKRLLAFFARAGIAH